VRDMVALLAVLACPLGMGLCMWLMSKARRGEPAAAERSIDELRAEHRRISAELEAAERRQGSALADPSGDRP
jgi:hypothetical protein